MKFDDAFKKYFTEAKETMMDRYIKKFSLDPKTLGQSCGKSTKDGKWYGWSHRAITGFGIGDKLFDERYTKKGADMEKMHFQDRGSKTIKTDEEAKQAARNFSKYVS